MPGMLWGLAFDVLLAALGVACWYMWFRSANRRRAVQILRWIESAFTGHATVSQLRWHSASRFEVDLQMQPPVFRRVSLTIQLTPREMPLNWLISCLRSRKETVTFEAVLDHRPAKNLQIQNHRWCGRTRRRPPVSTQGWHFQSLGPMVISSREDWQKDVGHMLEALIATRSCEFEHVAFRRKAPHIVASAPLRSLDPDGRNSGMFEILQELASSASTSRP